VPRIESDQRLPSALNRIIPDVSIFAGLFVLFTLANNSFSYVADDLWWLELRRAGTFSSVWELMAWHYFDWSSRVLSHGAVFLLIEHPLIWRLLTALAFSLICYLPVCYLTAGVRNRLLLTLGSLVMLVTIPGVLFFETGYLTTSAVYLWTWAAAVVAVYPAVAYLRGWRCRPAIVAISAVTIIFAANFELVAVFLLAAYAATIIVQIRRSLPFRGLIPFAIFSVAAIVFSLTAPGNARRTQEEMWQFPGYENLGLLQRVEMGYSSALRSVFMNGYLAPLVFFALLLLFLVYRRAVWWKIALAAFPVLGTMVLGFQGGLFWIPATIPDSEGMGAFLGRYLAPYETPWLPMVFQAPFQRTGLLRWGDGFSFVVFFTLTAMLIAAVLALFWVAGPTWRFWLALGLLGMGMASKAIVAFSPTVWASGSRTDVYLLLVFGLAALVLIEPTLRRRGATQGLTDSWDLAENHGPLTIKQYPVLSMPPDGPS